MVRAHPEAAAIPGAGATSTNALRMRRHATAGLLERFAGYASSDCDLCVFASLSAGWEIDTRDFAAKMMGSRLCMSLK